MKFADLSLLARLRGAFRLACGLLALACAPVFAGVTDISTAPLFTSSNVSVKPNIMFILDDSGSMAWNYLPDDAGNFNGGGNGQYGFMSSQCNGVAYDPTVTYSVPVTSTGTNVTSGDTSILAPNSSYNRSNSYGVTTSLSSTSTWPTGTTGTAANFSVKGNNVGNFNVGDVITVYGTSTQFFIGTVTGRNTNTNTLTGTALYSVGTSLSSGTIAEGSPNTYFTYSGSQTKLGYTYTSSGVITTTDFYKECASTIGNTPGSNVFTRVFVVPGGSEAQNYANWYQYYNTRIQMMQTAMTLAFKGVDNRYRVGYSTISTYSAAEGTNFLSVRDFDATQKGKFYTALNAATPTSSTPLRGALAKAGQYFATKAYQQASTDDPMLYSCQRNFTILSTDGYWNTGWERTSAPKYGPYQMDNSTNVGQQDGGATLRPMFDGGSVTATTTETWTLTAVTVTKGTQPTTTTTTVNKSTTTQKPTKGYEQYIYSLFPTSNPTSISRPTNNSPYLVTVTVASTAALGDVGSTVSMVITQTGGSNVSGYTGTVVATIKSATTFTYPSTTGNRPNSPSSASNYTVRLNSGTSCSVGQGIASKQRQTQDTFLTTVVSSSTTSMTVSSVQTTTTTTTTTPYTRILKVVNGVTVSDTTTTGSQSSVTATSSTTLASSPTVTASSNTTTSTGTTTWVDSGNSSYTGSCVSTAPANTTPAALATTTTSTVTTVDGPSTTGPTTATGTMTITFGPSTTNIESTHSSNSGQTTSGGTSDTLADVAMYYYMSDLRTTALGNCTGGARADGTKGDVCANNVPGNVSDASHSYGDSAAWQHMTTFTLGLGASGLLRYDPNYLTQLSGDFFDITNGAKNWPSPKATNNDGGPENIDDLWHAAVNGRGQYFSAGNPTALANSLNSALDSIKAITGAASAASTSSLQPVQGDNDIYVAQFTTQKWVGDVLSFKIDPVTGLISQNPTWSAKTQLDTMTPTGRTIYYSSPGNSKALRAFTYTNLKADSYDSYFDNFCSKTGANAGATPQQCPAFTTAQTSTANTGTNLVGYLRGDQTLNTYYRQRDNLLGDIINASPLFVGKPGFKYTENAYQSYVSANATRTAVVLAAANDGMLHALDRTSGNELWAFVPTAVLPNLYKLADTSYSNFHSYFVDGSPQIGDIYADDGDGNGAHWKTIVVGGLNDGGRSYYALELTDPAHPKLLWEFKDNNLGLTYGNPVITKRTDGTWVVVFGSGYNNVSPGDGNGRMFVLNANTGALITQIQTFSSGSTPAGSTSTPSGLAHINPWIDSETVNTAKRFYGGDLLGNLWRFDLDSQVQPNGAALRLAQLTGPTGATQPITVKPALAEVNYNGSKYPVAYVATGKYLGTTDLTDNSVQSVYAIKDPLTNTALGVVRSRSDFVTQTITASGTARTSTSNPVDWGAKQGWYADLPAGERVSVNPQLALTTLFVGSNLPSSDACTVGGQSFLYQFDIGTGTSVANYVGNVMIQGLTLVQLTTGAAAGSVVTIITRSDGTLQSIVGSPSTATNSLRRTSWRELVE